MRAARRKPKFGTAQLVLLLAAGCSLQDFDYLQKGTGGSNAGGTNPSAAGTSSTESGAGGDDALPGAGNGNGGKAPSGGTSSSGTDAGGTTSGGTSAGGTNTGGTSASGGKGGTGGGSPGPTGELINGSFETGTTQGWNVTPASALMNPPRYAFVQPPTSGATVPDGSYEFSTWHAKDSYKVDLHQTIEGIEDGTYVFKGYFNLGAGHKSVEVYASECGGEAPEPVAVLAGNDSMWSPIWLEGIQVKGGSCTVGVRIDSNPNNWLNADYFSFEPDPKATGGEGGAGGAGGAK